MNRGYKEIILGRIWLLIFFTQLPARLYSQDYLESFDRYTSRDGLPHNIILSVHQDRQGFLWIGTFAGLCRYDGHEFYNFNAELDSLTNGLPQAVEVIYEDSRNDLWIGLRSGAILQLTKKNYAWKLYKPDEIHITSVRSIHEDPNGNIWVGTREGYIARVDQKHNQLHYTLAASEGVIAIHSLSSEELLLVSRPSLLYRIQTGKSTIAEFMPQDAQLAERSVFSHGKVLIAKYGNLYCFIKPSAAGKAQINRIKLRPGSISGGTCKDGNFLVGSGQKLVKVSLEGKLIDSLEIEGKIAGEDNLAMNCFLEDRTGLVWIGTNTGLVKIDREKQVFQRYCASPKEAGLCGNYVRAIHFHGDEIWTGFKSSRICRMQLDTATNTFYGISSHKVIELDGKTNEQATINTFLRMSTGELIAGGLGGIFLLDDRTKSFGQIPIFSDDKRILLEVWTLFEDAVGRLWVGTNRNGLWIIDMRTKKVQLVETLTLPGDKDIHLSIWAIYKDRSGKIWIGSNQGLFEASVSGEKISFTERNNLNNQSIAGRHIWNILEDAERNLWIGSTDNGISVIDKTRKKIRYLNKSHGLPSNVISTLTLDRKKDVWIGTMNGLVRYSTDNGSLRIFYEEDGLLSNDFNFRASCNIPGKMIALGTKLGMIVFDPGRVSGNPPWINSPVIAHMRLMTDPTTFIHAQDGSISLTYRQNYFTFRLALLNFTNPARHRYRFKLLGLDKDWNYTDSKYPFAGFTNVPPGNYELWIQGSDDAFTWNSEILKKEIVIRPAFWQTGWFMTSVGTLIFTFIGLAVYGRVKTVVSNEKKRMEINKRISELELKALQAQMNPHFIFNSLNSIQHFILLRDEKAANAYLTKFATLMRLFLESSTERYIELSEEIKMIELYLNLEALRFEGRLKYSLNIAPDVPMDARVPTMLLQPFVENAINHGLLYKESGGELKVDILWDKEKSILLYVIDDNGIGRNAAMMRRSAGIRNHRSMGLTLVNERMTAYQYIDAKKIGFAVTDKTSADDSPLGTRVDIYIQIDKENAKAITT